MFQLLLPWLLERPVEMRNGVVQGFPWVQNFTPWQGRNSLHQYLYNSSEVHPASQLMGTDSVFPIGRADDLSASNAQVTTGMPETRATWRESLRYGAN